MRIGDVLHALVNLTHGNFGKEIQEAAHGAVSDLETRLANLERHVFTGDELPAGTPDVSRETSTGADTTPAEGTTDGAH